ncbi:mannose-6-phosphate isomerase, class I [Corynebacterium sp. zg254]|uniref:mannose-6-phosphate isomerase n=1 Tax=Corynebacterium zhongnanshanii TaxID=2768834 RepID=A0ABQ6VEX0_9CORY|nr:MULTISPECIES: mannose-6-phosphate isomerase, class I [Corynebacterium]KAB3522972.1 mannose-6-phosphate isomerase, class I [Corynebacterium zhongnanshanii]MCR5913945.1 mannose-6-phosphate isomerase, class I [Corynebacterium sp. zg254]
MNCPLEGVIRTYAWGSHTALAELMGRPAPTEQPEAELWLGAHPAAPSRVGDTDLQQLIAADPQGQLGPGREQLPFLLKLLAAERALSIQVHPTKAQAQEGFARENQQGIPLDAYERNYKDDNHKPELLVALTPFEALAGFRPVDRTRELIQALEYPELDSCLEMLGEGEPASNIRAVLTTWMTMPTDQLDPLLDGLVAALERVDRATTTPWIAEVVGVLRVLAEQYPGDRGLLCALLLNYVVLQPGEALFLDAGQLHAYVQGTGVEIMANSDNVLRGGLTSKHIDVEELLRIVRCDPVDDPRILPTPSGLYPTPADEFQLRHVNGEPVQVSGPAIVLAAAESVCVDGEELASGQALWVPARSAAECGPGAFVAQVP